MSTKFGFSGVNQLFHSSKVGLKTEGGEIHSVRVKSIVLNDKHPRFKELGEWNALGAIEFELVNNPLINNTVFPVAYPLYPNIKNYPLLNEIVFITFLSNIGIGDNNVSQRPYYISIVALWNHSHQNAYPTISNTVPPSQNKSYSQIEAGSPRVTSNDPTQINLGETFNEKSNIHPLLPFEGDIIHEGRWGNSIRLGSTVKSTPNNWSNIGKNGEPLIIIRNGQGVQNNEGWVPITEDINNDNSSIYLTSDQQIPIIVKSKDYTSYSGTPPTLPNEFKGTPQIILNSGRLVFNANDDHILLSSAKSINLNSQESVNIDTKKFVTQADEIYLGKEGLATEPLLLGNATVDLLNSLVQSLETLSDALKNAGFSQLATIDPSAQGPTSANLFAINIAAASLSKTLTGLKTQLDAGTLTSKRNFTL